MASFQQRGKNSFLLTVEAGYNSKGKRLRRTKTIKIEDESLLKTKKKLKDYLNQELLKFKMEVEAGEYIAPEKTILAEFINDWEKKYAEKELGEQTLDVYSRHIKNHILPNLGHMKLDQIKPIHIVNFLDQLKKVNGDPLEVSTVQYIYRVLRNILQRAMDWKIIKENPVANVKKPKNNAIDKEVNVYNESEVQLLFNAVQNEPLHWRVFTSLALAAGLRRGELLGLEWSNINFEEGTIRIKQVVGFGRNGKAILKKPKSKTSNRIISLPPSIVLELKDFHREWKKEKMRMRDQWIEEFHEFVFCNENGKHFYPSTPSTWWRRFISRTNIRYIRLHDLRHTSATLLINQGVHAKIISARLGHADIRITMDTYGHALHTADQEAANKLDGIFSKQKTAEK
ncbi:tyrosine-type recombinase/integrase [Sutcliffiella sp. NC1]|uniref:tyrosine-type recombinase/integrase n=1 Tax=Sutcliffiella sp. NC1 TaxID=3004096 RepID=UPI0022DE4E63|nr:site-specific integrase [Sutcliffiella sp. NC1]WBL16397.1 site-specific integrase [Sutcliffiella sp. NC1]